ncbi:Hypothetical predicted protein [Paramuricea clavata]|uniref:Uncharacterized protein n=1 Tax=Paramuricea clavata TaxID=317549 RepID=A0A6S7LI04_PARCT|nr:Hypothetical predicted protein [Paramuricea clavata]
MQAEFESLENNNTWTLVQEQKDRKVLPGKWVYKVKYGADGQIVKYKARCVAKLQKKDLHLGQMDEKSAYLHSIIEEEIYLEQPEGFVKQGENGQKLVCKLNKSIYGLKQAARN